MAEKDALDGNFNEDELADIMSEIEDLEKDFDDVDDLDEVVEASAEEEAPAQEEVSVEGPVAEVIEEPVEEEEVVEAKAKASEPIAEESIAESLGEEIGAVPKESASNEAELKIASEDASGNNLQNEIDSQFDNKEPAAENVVPMNRAESSVVAPSSKGSSNSEMSFDIAGDFNLKLNFNIEGSSVSLQVSETEGLVIELPGGGKFNIPFEKKAS